MEDFYNSGSPINKLNWILGNDMLAIIKEERPELYNALLEYITNKKNISLDFCQKLLA
jgi:hypothetical protein